jgi:hypothetical protein
VIHWVEHPALIARVRLVGRAPFDRSADADLYRRPTNRDYYIELCRLERWLSVQLNEHIQSTSFERSALSARSGDLIRQELT